MRYFTALLFACFSLTAFGQLEQSEASGKYLDRLFKKGNETLNYRIMYPHDFEKSKHYPLVVFLHGMGERGFDNNSQLVHGSRLFQDSLMKYPAIVLFPQCSPTDYWANLYRPKEGGSSREFEFFYNKPPNLSLGMVIDLINELSSLDFIDDNRIYATGLSMGGMGTFELAYRMNDKLAVAMPICGGGPREMASEITGVSFWIFHGMKDDVVHPRYSIIMLKALQQAGGQAKITLFENANHNSWDLAFEDKDFLKWMFAQKRSF